MTTETVTAHEHSFPCNPPGGTLFKPGQCACGKTYEQDLADRTLTEALEAVTAAYGVPPRVSEHWAVAYGSDDGTGCGVWYDDEEDAREHLEAHRPGSRVVRRAVIALRWEIVP